MFETSGQTIGQAKLHITRGDNGDIIDPRSVRWALPNAPLTWANTCPPAAACDRSTSAVEVLLPPPILTRACYTCHPAGRRVRITLSNLV